MEGNIKVAPETLASTATTFETQANQIRTLTGQMMELIRGLGSTWNGDASRSYLEKFNGLESDMNKIFGMISEHSKDLTEMASIYSSAEKSNVEASQSLLNNVIS